ncbi:MAG: hypothetical protein IMY86_03190 [Chloroflexi bacterium]|nr:hypothetical protein [Chloroflexota bacterium]
MSRKQWLVLATLALFNVIVLCAMAVVVIYSLTQSPSASAPIPTLFPTVSPWPTPPPTWTPTPTSTPQFTPTPRPTGTPAGTPTPEPTFPPTSTFTPTPLPTPTPRPLENPTFEGIQPNSIPGWQTGGFVNWASGDEFDPGTSYAAPRFHQADDPLQRINGPTLQIDTEPWVKLRAWTFQTVDVEPGSLVQFQIRAAGFVKDTTGHYILKAGVDPEGGEGCEAAQWGDEQTINQNAGAVTLVSPEVVAGQAGRVTVCAFAETQYAQVYHAAFFDDAALTTSLPVSP